MTTKGSLPRTSPELQRLLNTANDRIKDQAVLEGTSKKYDSLFRDVWTPLCTAQDVQPMGAPPATILALFCAARTGALRRSANGTKREGMLSPGYLDAVLAAIRHLHDVQGENSPLDAFTAEELADLRTGYRTAYALQPRDASPAPVMTVHHLVQLCRMGPALTREDGIVAAAGVLSLDAEATLDDLVALEDHHIRRDEEHQRVLVDFPGRTVTLACSHDLIEGIVPACAGCLLVHFAALPRPHPSVTATFAFETTHEPSSTSLRLSLYHRLNTATRWSPVLKLGAAGAPVRLQYAPQATPRLRTGARQLLVVAGGRRARGRLLAQVALKLAAARGLTPTDLFVRLTVADVRDAPAGAPGAGPLELRLPVTVRGRGQDVEWMSLMPMDDPRLCPVLALREWLLVREAAMGRELDTDRRVFVRSSGWSDGSAEDISTAGARVLLKSLLSVAGLADVGYRWESAQKLHGGTLVAQGASEVQLYWTLRRKKPEQMQNMLAELPGGAGGAPRAVAAGSAMVTR